MRIGQGYDVHRFAPEEAGGALILGGVRIPYELGLLGHSDADVLVHAIMDALLGAAALGDIGKMFPDTDDEYRGADSLKLLKNVCGVVRSSGYGIENIDSTIIAQSPRMSPYIYEMRLRVAKAADLDVSRVSIKATTEEGLGFTGAGLGIAAQAVALLTE